MQPIRVLHIVTYMGRGGLETMLMNYYRHIDRTKVQLISLYTETSRRIMMQKSYRLVEKFIMYPDWYRGVNRIRTSCVLFLRHTRNIESCMYTRTV